MAKFIQLIGPYDIVARIGNEGYHKNFKSNIDAWETFQDAKSKPGAVYVQLFHTSWDSGVKLLNEWIAPGK